MKYKRFRISPSPTGTTHLGTARTGLVSFILAKKAKAPFHLRLEDTDAVRSTEQFAEGIVEAFTWLGVDFEKEVIKQSEQETAGVYRDIAEALISSGIAYYCGCSPSVLKKMKAHQVKNKSRLGYVGACRDSEHPSGALRLNIGAVREFLDENNEFHGGLKDLRFTDGVYGPRHVDIRDLNDVVLMRGNGAATYIFANTVDDMLTGITDIVRGADILPQTALQIVLRRVMSKLLGKSQTDPVYTHVPLVLGENKEKLSKRAPTTTSIVQYREAGYLPEAIAQFALALGNKSIPMEEPLSMVQIIERYDESQNSKVNIAFSEHQLLFVNKLHLRIKSAKELNKLMGTSFSEDLVNTFKARTKTLVQLKAEIEDALEIHKTYLSELKALAQLGFQSANCAKFRESFLDGKCTVGLEVIEQLKA